MESRKSNQSAATTIVLVLALLAAVAPAAASQPETAVPLSAHYTGSISVAGIELTLSTHFAQTADSSVTGTFDIPQQGAAGQPLANVRIQGHRIHFEIPSNLGTASFDGSLMGDRIMGTFKQGGAEGTFNLVRTDSPGESGDQQPADPPDEPLTTPDVTLETPTGTLAGTLDLPAATIAEPPYPVALILAGSGPTDRDGNSRQLPGPNNCLKLIGQGLAEHGIAALRIDKRGVGASAAALESENDLRFEHYIEDTAAWLKWLAADERFGHIAMIGHSEGSLVGMNAVARLQDEGGTDIAAFVSLAGPGRNVSETIIDQLGAQPGGISDETLHVIAEMKAGRTVSDVSVDQWQLFRPSVQPYFISWMRYEPTEVIARLELPVFILQGGRDLQVPGLAAVRLAEAQPNAEYALIPTMNHVLKSVPDNPTANQLAYSDPTLPLADGFMEALVEFLDNVFAEQD